MLIEVKKKVLCMFVFSFLNGTKNVTNCTKMYHSKLIQVH